MASKAIGEYALISNCQSSALVARDGSIDWWCAPRFDSPASLARILDERGGHFKIAPADVSSVERTYVDDTMVLETTMTSATGTIVVTDALALGRGETGHQIGCLAAPILLRTVRCIAGSVDVDIEISLRPEFGSIVPLVERTATGADIYGGADAYVLSLPSTTLECSSGTIRARVHVRNGERVDTALERAPNIEPRPRALKAAEIRQRSAEAIEGWQSWARLHQSYKGYRADLVRHSGRVLQALTYQPAGSIVAAPTTSLAELPGGANNWDYRYCWIRDASLTMHALWNAACPDEAQRFFSWLAATAGGDLAIGELQIVFGVGGEHDLSERELPHLRGWRDSVPVRVGNDAWKQRQLDIYGEIAGAAFRFRDQFDSFGPEVITFVIGAIERAAQLWREPDSGIWETRDGRKHFVHSKLMCWQALECGIALAHELGTEHVVERWSVIRDEIAAAIRLEGWSDRRQSYVQTFGSDDLDASILLMITSGFLSPSDPRARSTVDAIARTLGADGLLKRYAGDASGSERPFVICSFWLAQAYAMLGDLDAARATFERTVSFANDVGLLAEEIDPKTGELLGNFPQAFSHMGLINAAAAIDLASR